MSWPGEGWEEGRERSNCLVDGNAHSESQRGEKCDPLKGEGRIVCTVWPGLVSLPFCALRLHLKTRSCNTYYEGLLGGANELVPVEHLKQCLEHSQLSEMSGSATTVKAETAVKGDRQGVLCRGEVDSGNSTSRKGTLLGL